MSNTEKERRQAQSDITIKENYRPKEAADFLCVGLSTIWLYIKQGKLQSKKLSDRVTIISRESLESFINTKVA